MSLTEKTAASYKRISSVVSTHQLLYYNSDNSTYSTPLAKDSFNNHNNSDRRPHRQQDGKFGLKNVYLQIGNMPTTSNRNGRMIGQI